MMRDYLYKGYLGDGEKILFVIHRHILLDFMQFVKVFFFGVFVPAFFWWLFPKSVLFTSIWLGLGTFRFAFEFLDWYYDAWLVTNVSVVEVMWKGFFDKSSTRIEYHIIQAIGYEVKGFGSTLLGCGSLTLDKFTGTMSVFEGAINPKKKSEMLIRAQEEYVRNKSFRDHRTLQGILSDLLQRHVAENGLAEETAEEMEE
jgi:hypothetical protein